MYVLVRRGVYPRRRETGGENQGADREREVRRHDGRELAFQVPQAMQVDSHAHPRQPRVSKVQVPVRVKERKHDVSPIAPMWKEKENHSRNVEESGLLRVGARGEQPGAEIMLVAPRAQPPRGVEGEVSRDGHPQDGPADDDAAGAGPRVGGVSLRQDQIL